MSTPSTCDDSCLFWNQLAHGLCAGRPLGAVLASIRDELGTTPPAGVVGALRDDVAAREKTIPMGRTGTPEDIAGMAVALLCDRFSGYVTGTSVAVDGGIALHNWIAPAG